MGVEFEKLKQQRAEAFNKLRASIQPTLGSHKSTRLSQAGCRDTRSLLRDDVARQHASMLRENLRELCEGARASSQDHFRLLTVLHAVTRLHCDDALREAFQIQKELIESLRGSGIKCLGAVEFEIVNLSLLRKIKSRSNDENRKLAVLENLGGQSLETGVLVHFHGVLNFSESNVGVDLVRSRLLEVREWQQSKYQIEIKQFFRDKSLAENLQRISSYLTKGGNETLRYKPGFGRDPDSQLDAQIWRGPSGRADRGAETIPDERGLTIGEIQLLDQMWLKQMATRDDDRGYVFELRWMP